MTTIYRVTVVAETTDAGGGYEGSETLFELAGGADIVGRLAPAALVDALLATAVAAREPLTVAERVMDAAASAGAPIETAEQTKRKRRTKAEIAADSEAQSLGFRDAAHRAESQQATTNTYAAAGVANDAPPPAAAGGGKSPATDVPTGTAPYVALTAEVPPPYNPFAVAQ